MTQGWLVYAIIFFSALQGLVYPSLNALLSRMTDRRVRHLPVIEQGRLAGIVSIGDLVKAVIEDQQQEIEQLVNDLNKLDGITAKMIDLN